MTNLNIYQDLFGGSIIRFAEQAGEPLICVTDVLVALEYKNTTDAWYSLKTANARHLGSIGKLPIVASNGKLYQAPFLNLRQLIVLLMNSGQEKAFEFQVWAYNKLAKEVQKQIEIRYQLPRNVIELIGSPESEKRLQSELLLLAAYSGTRLIPELPVADRVKLYRKFDLCRYRYGNVFEVNELKTCIIDYNIIKQIQGERNYLRVGDDNFPNKNVVVYLVGQDITNEAANILYGHRVQFKSINALAEELYIKAIKKCKTKTKHAEYYRMEELLLMFGHLLDSDFVERERERQVGVKEKFDKVRRERGLSLAVS